MSGQMYGDELLVCVFAQFPNATFQINDDSDVARAFFKAKSTGRYDALFNGCTFDRDGIDCSSRTISTALDSLQQARLLGRMNPDLVRYTISPAMALRYKRYVQPKIGRNAGKVTELAGYIKEQLRIKPSNENETTDAETARRPVR